MSDSKNVGILAMEVYTPSTYITQSKLEEHNGVSKGKYSIGLGQESMGVVCGDSEDVNSMALTVVHSLLEKYKIDVNEVGRLEIGTETLVDKSKSTKTVLMQLFSPNTDIEGATIVNACYGGTAALLNAFNWVDSSGWDGRYAIVVSCDIAAYARGSARPTCGAGAVACLIGIDAPLSFMDMRERVTHASHVWDFFKPDHTVEYPTVDGALSQTCYYRALEDCYLRFCDKLERLNKDGNEDVFDANSPDYWVFHAPYNKLVQKSYARLFLLDQRRNYLKERQNYEDSDTEVKKDPDSEDTINPLSKWSTIPESNWSSTYTDRELDSVLKHISTDSFQQKLSDANHASKLVGNTYTASVFFGLASLIDRVGGRGELTAGKSVVVFSYGSGAIASMYRLQVRTPKQSRFTIESIQKTLNLTTRLLARQEINPNELDYALETRARMHGSGAPYTPIYPANNSTLLPGTYYLTSIDKEWKRSYARIPTDAAFIPLEEGVGLAPQSVKQHAWKEKNSKPVTGLLSVMNMSSDDNKIEAAKRRVACVITGIAAGLPGREGMVFRDDNLERLVKGDQLIEPIGTCTIAAMKEKNVIQVKKHPDGTIERIPILSDTIQLAGQLGSLNLTKSYGIPAGLAETMDVASQVAVAAGMEALKSAGLVNGKSNDLSDWKLPEEYRDSTGVVYASSFPAMDAAVGEVMRFLQSKTVDAASITQLVGALRSRMLKVGEELSEEDEIMLSRLSSRQGEKGADKYEFDRKFLFRVLVLGNAQLAQLAGCRGPNTQTNAACAGTTQAIAMAQDMLISGRAERVVVVAGDNGSGDTLLPWLGSGFRALGAACTEAIVENAALPFDKRRSGMILGAGGIGMVLETELSSQERLKKCPIEIKARLLATQYSNSAFHGAALDRKHIASELQRFLTDVELVHGISKSEIATHGVYFSHETCTHASSASSCSGNEISALRQVFGDQLSKLLILNTKGYTGHPMGVSFEDVAAVEVLLRQVVPPIPNYKEIDEYLGELNLSKGGSYSCRYALRFAAGFGSQVAFALYATAQQH